MAEDIAVNSFEDRTDADLGDGVCDVDLGEPGLQCTLRAAVQHANATAGPDRITLPAGTYRLKLRGADEELAATGDLDIRDDVMIVGAGAATTIIDGGRAKDRVFQVTGSADVTITDLTIRKGKAPRDQGGGGILAFGTLALTRVVVSGNKCGDDGGGLEGDDATLTLTDVLFVGNKSKDDGGGVDVDVSNTQFVRCALVRNKAGGEGGALELSNGVVSMTNCTVSGNKAKTTGGGIVNEDGGTLTLTNCTIAFNKAKTASGISTTDEDFGANTTVVLNTIFAANKKGNCDAALSSGGGNCDDGTTCGFSAGAGDLVSTDPRLLRLADNGGATPTHALATDSPCIDAANDAFCPADDQRGRPRADCDIGAFEAPAT